MAVMVVAMVTSIAAAIFDEPDLNMAILMSASKLR